jgi:hypothetical protein
VLYRKKKDCRGVVRPRFQIDFTPLWHVLAVVYICDDHYSSETVHLDWRCRVLSSDNLLVLRSSHCIFPIRRLLVMKSTCPMFCWQHLYWTLLTLLYHCIYVCPLTMLFLSWWTRFSFLHCSSLPFRSTWGRPGL